MSKAKKEMQIGDVAADGWKYCGISPETKKPMYVAPSDINAYMSWHESTQLALIYKKQGTTECRLPSIKELKKIFNNKAKIGGFNEEVAVARGIYLSSTESDSSNVKNLCLRNGKQDVGCKSSGSSSTRFVRS